MKQYLDIVGKILREGEPKDDRTGVGTLAIFGVKFEHDMSEGFPLLTTKKMAHMSMKVELEGFLKGITDKRWYQERGCRIWKEWANPQKVPYGHTEEDRRKMREERDLGPIYGYQWRNFNGKGVDQIDRVVKLLDKDPNSRKMVVSAWNPIQLSEMALEPCHYSFQLDVIDDKLHLRWDQRSVDTMLGLPFNIASYGLLLHLFSLESGYNPGKLVGFLGDTHIYNNHIIGAREQLKREPKLLPIVRTDGFKSIFEWTHDKTEIVDYQSHDAMPREKYFPIAV